MATIIELPNEIIQMIFDNLELCDQINFKNTCKKFSVFSFNNTEIAGLLDLFPNKHGNIYPLYKHILCSIYKIDKKLKLKNENELYIRENNIWNIYKRTIFVHTITKKIEKFFDKIEIVHDKLSRFMIHLNKYPEAKLSCFLCFNDFELLEKQNDVICFPNKVFDLKICDFRDYNIDDCNTQKRESDFCIKQKYNTLEKYITNQHDVSIFLHFLATSVTSIKKNPLNSDNMIICGDECMINLLFNLLLQTFDDTSIPHTCHTFEQGHIFCINGNYNI